MVLHSALIELLKRTSLYSPTATDDKDLQAISRSACRLIMSSLLSPLDTYVRNLLLADMPVLWCWSSSGRCIVFLSSFANSLFVFQAALFSFAEAMAGMHMFSPVYRIVVRHTGGQGPIVRSPDGAKNTSLLLLLISHSNLGVSHSGRHGTTASLTNRK